MLQPSLASRTLKRLAPPLAIAALQLGSLAAFGQDPVEDAPGEAEAPEGGGAAADGHRPTGADPRADGRRGEAPAPEAPASASPWVFDQSQTPWGPGRKSSGEAFRSAATPLAEGPFRWAWEDFSRVRLPSFAAT